MSERDELVDVIRENRTVWATNTEHREMEDKQADAILAAGYRKPRTITTAEELKTVYEGAILRDCHGDLWGIDGATGRLFAVVDGADDLYDDDELSLPATVVYEEPTV